MIDVIPAILEIDTVEVIRKIHLVETLVPWVQIDIADGKLVPNTVLPDPTVFSGLVTPVQRELHMMVTNPLTYLDSFVKVGFTRFYAHVEADDIEAFIEKANQYNVEVGLAIDGPTPIEKLRPYIDNIDAVLVMAIEAGFSGKPYREDTAQRIAAIHDWDIALPIAVDGAMNEENARKVVAAGATRICSNSYIFNAPDIRVPIATLRNLDNALTAGR